MGGWTNSVVNLGMKEFEDYPVRLRLPFYLFTTPSGCACHPFGEGEFWGACHSPLSEGCPKGGVFPSFRGVPEGRGVPLFQRGARRAGCSPLSEGCPCGVGVAATPQG